ncbi:hypothetical protein Ari01nite_21530 [Paractinoplanes rishiriensis]|uniref:GGDEF domain-containing protein n=1 Tax=Paractinoplanes rishiriensis TaxID=1050105 RepID=A0A919MTF2_9ACTN|nr:hypothetical protein Ari01nite_21530 [Actinoplanes rishiriensis]
MALETARAAQLEVTVATVARERDLADTLRVAMNEVGGKLDPDVVLETLTAAAQRLVGASRAWLVPPDESVGADVSGGGVTASADDQWTAAFIDADVPLASWLCMPLSVRAEPVSFLVLASDQTDAFGPAQVEILAAVIAQSMVAYENARLFSQVSQLATIDGLTQVANRRHFMEIAGHELAEARGGRQPLAVIMADIDHFKRINDTWGHQAGDDVIRTVAARLRDGIRDGDVVCRYGGEEFAVVLPDAGDAAPIVAERLRAAIAETPVDTVAGPLPVTISVGVAYLAATDSDVGTLLGRADECLYRAKHAGRNRVAIYPDDIPGVTVGVDSAA